VNLYKKEREELRAAMDRFPERKGRFCTPEGQREYSLKEHEQRFRGLLHPLDGLKTTRWRSARPPRSLRVGDALNGEASDGRQALDHGSPH
jgi:hypothetical protein